jgi:glycosyltransferase involved in cell wall biosynthesis
MNSKKINLKSKFVFAVHDFHPRGGHERSNLELLSRLQNDFKIEAFSYELEGAEDFLNVDHRKVMPKIRKPDSLKIIYFLFISLYFYYLLPLLSRRSRPKVLSTGTASCVSDIVQVQFVNARWKREAVHGSGLRGLYYRLLLEFNVAIEKVLYSSDKTYIAISEGIKKELMQEFHLDRVNVIHHGVNTKEFRPLLDTDGESRRGLRREFKIPEDAIVILFAGAYDRKGLAQAIEGLAHVPVETRNNVRLLAVGGGDRAHYSFLTRKLGIADQVVLSANRRDISDLYRMSDIFLLPTRYEPFGLVILEAMASGLPAVVSMSAGASELIVNGINGFTLEDPSNTFEIASKLELLIQDKELRKKIGSAARQKALLHDWDAVADKYRKVLNLGFG